MKQLVTAGILLLAAEPAWAHYPFETTVTASLRHGRLEVVVDMANQMASLLVQDPANPEAPPLSPASLDGYRPLLEQRAGRLYEITAGATMLVPDRVVASVSEADHLKLTVFYPQPVAWPLKFHALRLENIPPGYTSALRVMDDDEGILGLKTISPQAQQDVVLSVSPKLGAVEAPLVPATTPKDPPKLPLLFVAFALVLSAVVTVIFTRWSRGKSGG